MTTILPVDSKFHFGRPFNDFHSVEVIKNEPMLFNCDLHGAYILGGPITRGFLDAFVGDNNIQRRDFHKYVVDSRVHMLMKGWFPCIPGFHHDDVPRTGPNGQPDYMFPAYHSKHCMGLVNGDICPTEFAIGEHDFIIPKGIIYKQWHEDVTKLLEERKLISWLAPSGRLIYFDDRTWHQGTRAKEDGWRWFCRISWDTDRAKHVTNEVRKQVQVYLEHPMTGW